MNPLPSYNKKNGCIWKPTFMFTLINNEIKFKSIHWCDKEFHKEKTYDFSCQCFEQIHYFSNFTPL